ncbi:hypothetical protein [Amycolatopsis sp. CA-126428]|uniref:hypothetical protein n=1 Tax=Amycolatopsis sp. CA-126428 TaxID=2073158 RepID=UPI000CD0773D|nr:hypothetical protein [Amycolatopsis sp. CA-126428]
MATFLNILLHVMLLGSMLVFIASSVLVTFRTDNALERAIRASALFCGAMVVLGAQAAGLGFAEFTVNALSNTDLAGTLSKVAGAAVPATFGVVMGRYLSYSVRRSENLAIRVMAFVGTLAATQFAAIYAIAVKAKGLELGASAIPNISFVVGILLYVVLKYEPGKQPRPGRLGAMISVKLRARPVEVAEAPPGARPRRTEGDSRGQSV